ncbi:efflux RND transporter periplasmic adaptor subunit [Leeuwenhoekiella marinoflava]|uniref:efflux RND transporter periplasmic adaptor subunit n=1 Tax=Leeuwenhoekiella marinoflava TaxID=988 RepID=UPI003001B63C|tara:strand:- start:5339 stop:6406 length:1068 start_codon:yes stop_codon:yes gene_type:complete
MNQLKNSGLLFLLLSILSCKDANHTREIKPIEVAVITIGENDNAQLAHTIRYSGIIKAEKTVNLSFQVSGTVVRIPIETGELVAEGQLIAEIDETTYREQYNSLQAQLQLAKENFERINEVFRKGSIAEIRMLEARSNYEQAQAAAKAQYQNIKHTKLYAPIGGYLGQKMLEAGDIANPGQPVVQIMNIETVKAILAIPDNEINQYQKGDKAMVTLDALTGENFEGIVDEVSIAASQNSPVYTVHVNIENPKRRIKPGMAASIVLERASVIALGSPQPIVVPARAISVDQSGKSFVYLVDQQKNEALRHQVETGDLYDSGIEITSGLHVGDLLVVSGHHKLTNNTPVKIAGKQPE